MFSKEDSIEIQRLAHVVVATGGDCESIYKLYKRYINPNASMYSTSCNCHTSISNYYQKLLDFYGNNVDKFDV